MSTEQDMPGWESIYFPSLIGQDFSRPCKLSMIEKRIWRLLRNPETEELGLLYFIWRAMFQVKNSSWWLMLLTEKYIVRLMIQNSILHLVKNILEISAKLSLHSLIIRSMFLLIQGPNVRSIIACCSQMCKCLIDRSKITLFSRLTEDISKEKQPLKLLRTSLRLTPLKIQFTTWWVNIMASTGSEKTLTRQVSKLGNSKVFLKWVKKGTTTPSETNIVIWATISSRIKEGNLTANTNSRNTDSNIRVPLKLNLHLWWTTTAS